MIFQTSVIMFHVNFPGCTSRKPPQKPWYVFQKTPAEMWRSSCVVSYCIINPWPMAHFMPFHHLRYVGEYSITVYFSLSFLTNYTRLYLTNRPEFSRNLLGGISPNTTLMGREMWNLYTSQQFHSTHLYEELNFGHVFGRRYDRCHYRGTSFLAFSSVKALERSWYVHSHWFLQIYLRDCPPSQPNTTRICIFFGDSI